MIHDAQKRSFLARHGWKWSARQLDNVERVYHTDHGFMTLDEAYAYYFEKAAS